MKKVKKIFKNNIKLVLGIIIGLVIAGGSFAVYAITATNITYTDNYSIGATTVQGAIDKLYEKAKNAGDEYFDFATAKANTTGKVFASKKGVCIARNKTVYCFKAKNWSVEKKHIKQVFSDVSCGVYSSAVDCYASDFYCSVSSNGGVFCDDRSDYSYCTVESDGSVDCN